MSLSEIQNAVGSKVILRLGLFAFSLYLFYLIFSRVSDLENRLEVLETIRPGVPAEYLNKPDLKLYRKVAIDYEGRTAELLIYRSSGTSPLASKDFIVIVDSMGVVISAFHWTSETPHDQLLKRLGVDFSGRDGINN